MKRRLAKLAEHRQRLLARTGNQRMELAEIARNWQTPLAVFDAGMKAACFIHKNPGLVGGGLVAFLSLRGTGVAGLARKGWRLLYLYPAAISLGLKYLLSSPCAAGDVGDPGVNP
jgi:YqjK-like protein